MKCIIRPLQKWGMKSTTTPLKVDKKVINPSVDSQTIPHNKRSYSRSSKQHPTTAESCDPNEDWKWFESLLTRSGCLNTEQMDALINLCYNAMKQPSKFSNDWTAMEMICWVHSFKQIIKLSMTMLAHMYVECVQLLDLSIGVLSHMFISLEMLEGIIGSVWISPWIRSASPFMIPF